MALRVDFGVLRANGPYPEIQGLCMPSGDATFDENVGAAPRAVMGLLNRGPEIAAEDSGSTSSPIFTEGYLSLKIGLLRIAG